MRSSFQRGSVIRVKLKTGDCWRFRFREGSTQRSEYLGTVRELPTRAIAEKRADRFRRRINTDVETITISDLIAKFWRESPPERETTAHGYRAIFNRIEAEYGHLRIDALAGKTADIEQWLNNLETVRGKTRLASPLYRGQVKNLLHLLFEKAMLWQHLQTDRNPIELVRLRNSSQRQKEITVLTLEQYQTLLNDPELPLLVKTMVQVAAGLGLRVSEILGLRWEDFSEGRVSIRRSVVQGARYETKTLSSRQVLPVHENIAAVLREWRESELVVAGWVFGSARTGLPYDRDYLRSQYLIPAGERIGVEGLGWHSFRHQYRSMMRRAGVSLEDQKNLMRHSKLATTIDTYGGEDSVERVREANAKVVDILSRRTA